MLRQGFEASSAGPSTDAEASRFLAQATFGATPADIARVRQLGYQAWLDEQFAAPASTSVQFLYWAEGQPDTYVSEDTTAEIWAINAIGSPDPSNANSIATDQLRQRIAFALSEIFVVSSQNATLGNHPWAVSSYHDMLVANALGNYRTLLEAVTLHPAMGIYLNMIQNQKADETENIQPDENYAREVMQLFSVGLVMLNPDGTVPMQNGHPIPTYNQATVRGFAAAFTGWNWNNIECGTAYPCCNAGSFHNCGPSNRGEKPWLHPMQPVEAYHDRTTDKQLLRYDGVALPNGVLVHGGDARAEMAQALDNIFRHPNVGPFMASRLIQRLVTSNPTPGYVQRVAAKFDDNGQGVRGDLKAVVRAILLDTEARYGQWQRPDTFGKLREPMLKLTHLWRAMESRTRDGRIGNLWMEAPPIEGRYGQAPLRSPTVFNFFKPDYRNPGEIRTLGLFSPEFQILSDTTAVLTPNNLFRNVFCYYLGSNRCYDSEYPNSIQMNYGRDAPLAASNPGQLIDKYDVLFMGGQMSPFMRDVLLTQLNSLTTATYGATLGRVRVQNALYLILNSPEYSIQK